MIYSPFQVICCKMRRPLGYICPGMCVIENSLNIVTNIHDLFSPFPFPLCFPFPMIAYQISSSRSSRGSLDSIRRLHRRASSSTMWQDKQSSSHAPSLAQVLAQVAQVRRPSVEEGTGPEGGHSMAAVVVVGRT